MLQGYGDHLQLSVFRVKGTRLHMERMQWELERLLAAEDDLLVVPLCPQSIWPGDISRAGHRWQRWDTLATTGATPCQL